ncbi:Uncharacterised protein [Serratia proteamaculans]|uniref:hypothetical protein n=1 Tax=Serratia proteamaculans TaxID=28151 RepID=UPI0021831317|nr:hypothetical protein [Serratia proteamaculans]CAI2428953.1 Uncharacterised protein [Serratia proteamaculans]HEJ7884118.1 hypothetical protein [Serratia liquefaciens]
MAETEAIRIISQVVGWIGLIALFPYLYRFGYAFAYYLTGRLKKHHKIIVQYKEEGKVLREVIVDLDSSSPIIKQLENPQQAER